MRWSHSSKSICFYEMQQGYNTSKLRTKVILEHQTKMKGLKKALGSKTTKDGIQVILNKALNKV